MVIEYPALTITTSRAVTKPAHSLVPLRAVGRHSPIIAPDPPERVLIHLVNHGIRTFEMTGRGHLVIYHLSLEILQGRLIRQPAYLHETEPMIHEQRMPDKLPIIPGDVIIPRLGRTKILCI